MLVRLSSDTLPLAALLLAKLGLVEEPAGEGEAWLTARNGSADVKWWRVVDSTGLINDLECVGAGCGGYPGCGGSPGVG